ncbi:hypothetical protein SAMN05444008_11918 [Cnuella takakiae]|uniref:Tetratricopeptide repeat-containing protein n=1 Tax=Cnuella takakiae TaxID=1302690 RepID=A0A1M5HDZ5_9BACT|nr:hypothetical protein [Cnuella takakiae]OLY92837.1 hypothetical protein BUE76_13785 [Cnuella takakiae]SHG14209.1 hypothetical protein SAMN05444008_11918 [Cnuella takakiae]
MSSRFDLIAQQVFQKDFAFCTLDELEQYAAANPYFAAAQFLLTKKLQETNPTRYQRQVQKAALYFHQPAAFEAFLLAPEFEPTQAVPEILEEEPSILVAPENETEDEAIATEILEPAPAPEAEPVAAEKPFALPVLPKLNAEPSADALAFEPFHTVDYFASQGIKLSQADLPKDKFGKQLMSFTAWLKTMKKLPASEHAKNMDPQAEARVETMAAHSVNSSDIVTETMAEIWIKQGQPAKATEIYKKLSLLHPSKKAYFAAKLENLKQ